MSGENGSNGDDSGRAKSAHAFRTIREVSDAVGVAPHILRFWETRFAQLKPIQRGGNRRYYRPADVALAHALHRLLHEEGYTVKGVQKLIASDGLAAVVARGNGTDLPDAGEAVPEAPASPQPTADHSRVQPFVLDELRAIRDRLARALAA